MRAPVTAEEVRMRSYAVARQLEVGEVAVFLREGRYGGQPLPVGTRMTVRLILNAGFRGIEVSGQLDDGALVTGISAGLLVPEWGW